MGGAAFDPLTPKLIKILNFSHFHQKEHEKNRSLQLFKTDEK